MNNKKDLMIEALRKKKVMVMKARSDALASFFRDGRLDADATERMTEEIWEIKQELKSLGFEELHMGVGLNPQVWKQPE